MEKKTRSKGIAFAIDALFAIVVIAAFAITAVPASLAAHHAGEDAAGAASRLSETTLRAMCLATVSELSASSSEIAALHSDGNLTSGDSEMTACQLVARLEAEGNSSTLRATAIASQIIGPLTPEAMGLAVYADGTLIYNSTFEPSAPNTEHASTAFVYSYGKAGVAADPIGPVKMEARAWWP